jgi:hypothetical protein
MTAAERAAAQRVLAACPREPLPTAAAFRLGGGHVQSAVPPGVLRSPGAATGAVAPASERDCPASAPVKGNAGSMIYHLPGSTFYSRTEPEECFATAADAQRAGYRAPRR